MRCSFVFYVRCRSDPAFQPIELTGVIGCVWKYQTGEDDIQWQCFARNLDEVEDYGTDGVEKRSEKDKLGYQAKSD
jgi:hypothetical protein